MRLHITDYESQLERPLDKLQKESEKNRQTTNCKNRTGKDVNKENSTSFKN